MWSKVGVLLFVGIVAATNNAWLPETEYTYSVKSRSLTSLDFDDQYSGVFYKAKLSIKTGSWNNVGKRLTARLVDLQVSKKHNMTIPNGWEGHVDITSYEKLPFTEQPFHIHIKENVIEGIEVTSKMSKWEANLIRGIVSQFQLQVDAKQGCSHTVMEQTVTGEYETVYEFCNSEGHKDDAILYVTKTKNFEVSETNPSIHYGFGDMPFIGLLHPNGNQMGKFFSRSSVSEVKIMGQLHRYNISTSETVNEISVSPTLTSGKRAFIGSKVNVTLEKRTTATQEYPKPESPKVVSIIYEQDTPFDKDCPVSKDQHEYKDKKRSTPISLGESGTYDLDQTRRYSRSHIFQSFIPYARENNYEYLNQKIDIQKEAKTLAKEIGHEIQYVEGIPKKQSLSKYIHLTHLVTLMTKEQIGEVTKELYNRQEHGVERAVWQVWRDSVADAGTYSAFVSLKEWITEKKVYGREAGQLISTYTVSVPVVTPEIAKAMVEFTKDKTLLEMQHVNDSTILACGTMMHRFLMNSVSPVYTYGNKDSKNDEHYVAEYVDYLTEKLRKAVKDEDNHRMNVYIRAIGNIGHKKIIESFEMFWSKNEAPLFQRVQSILALDEIVKVYPGITSEVLFRIYNSQQLPQEMRVAAVYKIIHSNPTKIMLQQMARNTNTDVHEYVNAAVQSTIREAASLTGEQYDELSKNAASALHLLTDKVYGYQYSKEFFRDYITRNVAYVKKFETIGSMDSFIPKGIRSRFYGVLGGIRQEMFEIETLTSSVDELLNFFKLRKIDEGRQTNPIGPNDWYTNSSETEQLQGLFRYKFEGIEDVLSFDNESIYTIIKELHERYNNKQLQMNKIVNNGNLFLSAPVESGFFYTFAMDTPTYFGYNGKVSMSAQPSLTNGKEIQKVKQFTVKTEAHMVVSRKIQSHLSLITVFDHHTYTSGFDKNWQVSAPLKISVQGDLPKNKYDAEIEPIKSGDFSFFHYSTWPFLGHRDVFDTKPLSLQRDTRTVIVSPLYNHQTTYGKQSGIAVRLNTTSEHPITLGKLYEKYRKEGVVPFFMSLFHSEEIDHTDFNLSYSAGESIARRIKIEGKERELTTDDINTISKKTGKGFDVNSWSDKTLYTVKATMQGGKDSVTYDFDFYLREDSVKVSKLGFFQYRKNSDASHITPYHVVFAGEITNKHVPQLMYKHVFDMELKGDGYYGFCIGERCESGIHGPIKFKRSEDRKKYLSKLDEVTHCYDLGLKFETKPQAQCDNLTDIAGLYDHFDANVNHDNSKEFLEVANKVYEVLGVIFDFLPDPFFRKEVKQLQGRFSPDFSSVNITGLTGNGHYSSNFIPVGPWGERIFAVHPRYDLTSRIVGKYLETRTYDPICVVDPVHITTFDDRVYKVDYEDKQWYLITYYNETFSQTPEDDKHITYTVLSRKVGNTKEVTVKVMHPKTGDKIATVELMPVGNFKPTIKINSEQQKWNTTEAGSFYHRFIRFYGNTDNELRVDIGHDLYIIYNGQSFRIAAKSDYLRGDLSGLCGNFDGNMYTDTVTPVGCLADTLKGFVDSYRYPMTKTHHHYTGCGKTYDDTAKNILTGLHVEGGNTGFRKYSPRVAHGY